MAGSVYSTELAQSASGLMIAPSSASPAPRTALLASRDQRMALSFA